MATLIVYGKPPQMAGFTAGVTPKNRASFEALLLPQLERLAGRKLRPATAKAICHPEELKRLVSSGAFDTLVFYGHAFTFTLIASGQKKNEMQLQTSCGAFITPAAFSEAIKSTYVRTVLIAGCASNAFAADVSTRVDGVTIGGLNGVRVDEIRGDQNIVSHLLIIPQPIKWWGK